MAAEWSATPVAFENAPVFPALEAARDSKSPWVRFVIRDGDGSLQTVGSDSRLDRFAGVLITSVFVAQDTGTRQAASYADDISAIWKGYAGQSCVRFGTPSITVVGEANGWFQINVTVTFQNDEIS